MDLKHAVIDFSMHGDFKAATRWKNPGFSFLIARTFWHRETWWRWICQVPM
jgi:hypothetical protein